MTATATAPLPAASRYVVIPTAESLPAEMVSTDRWITWWKFVKPDGGIGKEPIHPLSGALIDSQDRDNWMPFKLACQVAKSLGKADGVGLVMSKSDDIVCIDVDNAFDDAGALTARAREIVDLFPGTFVEKSLSGRGLHVFIRGKLSADKMRKRTKGVEVYAWGQFICVTADRLDDRPLVLAEHTTALERLYDATFGPPEAQPAAATPLSPSVLPASSNSFVPDYEVPERMFGAKNGIKAKRLWDGDTSGYDDDESSADCALCSIIAFWVQGDPARIDAIFRKSKLYRAKWERPDYRERTIAKALEGKTAFYSGGVEKTAGKPKKADYKLTDIGNSERFRDQNEEKLRHVHPWKRWIVWDGSRWALDRKGEPLKLAKRTIRRLWNEAAATKNPDNRDALLKFAKQSESSERVKAAMNLAACELPVMPEELDTDPWLLNCPNGTVDLKTGQLRSHRREDFITRQCPTSFKPDAKCPGWEAFLDSVFGSDRELIGFVQRFLGSCLSGDVSEQVLAIFHGEGSNGKTTLLNAIRHMLGSDYYGRAPKSLLTKRAYDSHPTDMMTLFGMRLVAAIETDEGRELDEVLVKQLTGGDEISGRRMREDNWSFMPTHKLILSTNHVPEIRGTDHAIWRRIALVPFAKRFWNPDKGESGPPELRQNKQLTAELKLEAEGILAWCVRGLMDWQTNGLRIPSPVQLATNAFRETQNLALEFLRDPDYCSIEPAREVRASALHIRFLEWNRLRGEFTPIKQRRFGEMMKAAEAAMGITKFKNSVWHYRGVGISATRPDQ